MTEKELAAFEKTTVQFGKFKGATVAVLIRDHRDWVDWLIRETEADRFKAKLREYVEQNG